MSLPWFPLHVDDHLFETKHLSCEQHGAYLRLMLMYFRTERPLPTDDDQLLNIVGLTKARWLKAKSALSQFFREENGLWVHDLWEAQIIERRRRHEAKVEVSRKGGFARNRNKKHNEISASPLPAADAGQASGTSDAMPEAGRSHAHLHLQDQKDSSGSTTTTTAFGKAGVKDQVRSCGELEDWSPTEGDKVFALSCGITDSLLFNEIDRFRLFNKQRGTVSQDLSATWRLWCQQYAKMAARQNSTGEPSSTLPDWDAAAERWARWGTWHTPSLGPEPGQLACRCPPELLVKYGVDPETGDRPRRSDLIAFATKAAG
jgi:uncharacterized protein YdaU (DUF1376 family)